MGAKSNKNLWNQISHQIQRVSEIYWGQVWVWDNCSKQTIRYGGPNQNCNSQTWPIIINR